MSEEELVVFDILSRPAALEAIKKPSRV